ncbi:hypothetical protein P170DRAFT_461183 [Aspergillus steynii IBT 23096]|uniref:Flavin reductase like domain-containing protein n=1 Tax=Aspergillus steynii IBT 23096 TaxID=1392250 RepID=A0A2I2GQY8_9EURO|nr:uncharacterized protein P170DRAFT_461183 [Aspergillus steynii IBT 23096]PLB55271.1 hypothetical protein P170DRAFT_461183 [Aspergillus steynii IBT 23096]
MKLLPSPRLAGRIADPSGFRCTYTSATQFSCHLPRCSLRRTVFSDVTGSRTSTRCFSSSRHSNGNNQPSANTEPPSLSLPDQVRLLMRRVPYPVAIITSTDPSGPNSPRAFRGMTVSSFNTVTLHPDPVVSFNVRHPSETLAALQSSGRFLIHLLAADAAPASLARDFSRGNHNLSLVSGESDFEFVPHTPTTSTDGSGASRAETSEPRPLPLLRQKTTNSHSPPAFPFIFECLLHPQNVTVADHTIVVGTVVRALSSTSCSGGSEAQTASADDLCLTYANTHFWKMGEEI